MKKDCLICAFSELKLGDARVFCHHPITPHTKVIYPQDKCPAEKEKSSN